MTTEEDLRLRVVNERERRGLSISAAARMGGASHETWRQYEALGNLTPTVVRMVAAAFSWPLGWHQGEQVPASVAEERDDVILVELAASRVAREAIGEHIRRQVDDILDEVKRSRQISAERSSRFAERLAKFEASIGNLIQAVSDLERRVAHIEPPTQPTPPLVVRPVRKRTSSPATRSPHSAR
jgi:hypothetical protein